MIRFWGQKVKGQGQAKTKYSQNQDCLSKTNHPRIRAFSYV